MPAQTAFVAFDFLILMQSLRLSCINRKLEQMPYCPQHIILQSEEILYQQRRMPCFQRPLFSIVHMIHIHPHVSSSGYHRISVFSFFPPSFLSFVGDSSSSANPRFLNSSFAIRFLRSILAIYLDARKGPARLYLSIRQVRYDFAKFLHSGSFIPFFSFIHARYFVMTSLHSPISRYQQSSCTHCGRPRRVDHAERIHTIVIKRKASALRTASTD